MRKETQLAVMVSIYGGKGESVDVSHRTVG
jgi:hypothetical protein